MKMLYIIIGLVFVIGLIFFLNGCKNKSNKPLLQEAEDINEHQILENPFEGLRNLAFSTTPEQMQLVLPKDETVVFGVIMDWGIEKAVATTVAYQTGDASLYLSSGGGIIGGGHHQNVNHAAKLFVQASQSYLAIATKTQTTPLPETDSVMFYFLTNDGVFVGQEQMKNFENHSSPWYDLFEEGNKVLTELHQMKENK